MRVELSEQSAGRSVSIYLDKGEAFTAEVGAMIAMDSDIVVETTSRQVGGAGGILSGIKRMFSGENFFLNHFTSQGENMRLVLGPKLVGDIGTYSLQGNTLIVQGFSWLASAAGVREEAVEMDNESHE